MTLRLVECYECGAQGFADDDMEWDEKTYRFYCQDCYSTIAALSEDERCENAEPTEPGN